MRIFKLEDVVLQNNSLFVYDQLQKCLSATFDNYFHKTTDHHSHNTRGEKLNLPITLFVLINAGQIIAGLMFANFL